MKQLLLIVLLFWALLAKADIYGVFVGISLYDNPMYELPAGTANDAKLMYNYFVSSAPEGKAQNLTLLTNSNCTKKRILAAMEKQFSKAKAGDIVVFFYSGHGLPEAFTTYQTNEFLTHAEVNEVFKRSEGSLKFCIADACFSGSMYQTFIQDTTRYSRMWDVQDMIVFMSSRTNEMSFSSSPTSYFSTFLLEGLKGKADANKDYTITVYELYTYVSKKMSMINGIQHPVMFGKFDRHRPLVHLRKKEDN